MPRPIPWAAKFGPDPKHPGYSTVVGSYAADFLDWAKIFGRPTWSPRGDQCVLGRPIELRPPRLELVEERPIKNGSLPDDTEFEVLDRGCRFRLYWPLSVLEPIYESMRKWDPVSRIVDPRTGEPILRSAI